ncbi:UPF0711 protein C18orf21 homolog [Vanacampus margaritifer]
MTFLVSHRATRGDHSPLQSCQRGYFHHFFFNQWKLEPNYTLSVFILHTGVHIAKHFGGKTLEPAVKLSVCEYCFQRLGPDDRRVRLRPKRRPSTRVRRLLRRRAAGKALSLMQKRLLRRFWTSSSVLMATCHTCGKTSSHKGMSREFLSSFPAPGSSSSKHKTPPSAKGSNARNTPGKTPSKDKTPHRTPRSAASSGTPGSISSSSSTPSAKAHPKGKNWVVRRLRNILMCEDKPVTRKDSLKDFLSSL